MPRRRWLPPLLAAWFASLPAAAQPGPPPENRVYALQGGEASLPLPDQSCARWQLRGEAGDVLREAVATAGGSLALPPGGWFRLYCVDGAGLATPVGGRFAAGLVVLVTGQSQADGFFFAGAPALGAFAAGPGDPPPPPVGAVLHDCTGQPGCGPQGVRWRPPGEALGARMLLAELVARLGPVPVALVAASWGGADAAALADPVMPAGERLRRLGAAAQPLSVALILAHGTSDALQATPPPAYNAALEQIVGTLRGFGPAGMPVLQAPLGPLTGPTRLLGSARLAAWLPFVTRLGWARQLGLASRGTLPPAGQAGAEAIRAAQRAAAARLGLGDGGATAGIALGPDGLHWSADGVRQAAREAATAIAAVALR